MSTFKTDPLSILTFDKIKDIEINDNLLALVLLRATINLILELGEHEHQGDWEPYLIIQLNDGSEIKSTPGYARLYFEFDGDKTSPMQLNPFENHKLITGIGIITEHFFTGIEIHFFPITRGGKPYIKSITLADKEKETND